MTSGKKYSVLKTTSITLDADIHKAINDRLASEEKYISFSTLVNELLRKHLKETENITIVDYFEKEGLMPFVSRVVVNDVQSISEDI